MIRMRLLLSCMEAAEALSRDVRFPVVNMDEQHLQLMQKSGDRYRWHHDVPRFMSIPLRCSLFTEALRGWRKVSVQWIGQRKSLPRCGASAIDM